MDHIGTVIVGLGMIAKIVRVPMGTTKRDDIRALPNSKTLKICIGHVI